MLRPAFVVLVLAFLAGTARADDVDDRIRELGSSDYKVRLLAVASLAKTGDSRAIDPLVVVLRTDSETSLRGAAAVALSKLVPRASAPRDVIRAAKALSLAASRDPKHFVRKRAAKAFARIRPLLPIARPPLPGMRGPPPIAPPPSTGTGTPNAAVTGNE
jgi:hypothetical protein